VRIDEIVDARKNVIKSDGAWQIFQDIETLYVGRGKKTVVYTPNAESKEEILKLSLGRTGNLRAPALRVGKAMYVGYNDAMYEELIG
jgi:ATPase subunit of ABC transporter with duplicated ATPase domains